MLTSTHINSILLYMSQIQYISTTHTSKDMAKEHKQKCNLLHNIYLKDMTFEEVADLLDAGCIIGRVGNNTDFVAIDVDKTSINIHTVIEHYKDNKDIAVSYGSSNDSLKYHILVNLHRTITRDEYKSVAIEEFEKLRTELCKRCDYMELDNNANKFYQCFYGASVDNESEYILDNSRRLFKWTSKDKEPMFYIDNKTIIKHPSLNSADYCKKNNLLTVKEDKRYDIFLPSMTRGKVKKTAVGFRYNWSKMIGAKLMMRVFYLNNCFNESWTKVDYLNTFEWVVRTNVVLPDEFCNSDDYKGLVRFFDNKWDILFDKPYESICEILEPYFDVNKRQYKSRRYNSTICTEIINNYLADNNNIVFEEKEVLVNICNEYSLNYYRTINYIKSLGYNIVFVVEHDNRIKYNVEGMNLDEFNKYCKEHNINRVTKSRLKKKFNIS